MPLDQTFEDIHMYSHVYDLCINIDNTMITVITLHHDVTRHHHHMTHFSHTETNTSLTYHEYIVRCVTLQHHHHHHHHHVTYQLQYPACRLLFRFHSILILFSSVPLQHREIVIYILCSVAFAMRHIRF